MLGIKEGNIHIRGVNRHLTCPIVGTDRYEIYFVLSQTPDPAWELAFDRALIQDSSSGRFNFSFDNWFLCVRCPLSEVKEALEMSNRFCEAANQARQETNREIEAENTKIEEALSEWVFTSK